VLLSTFLSDSGAHVSGSDYRYPLYGAHDPPTCIQSINAADDTSR